MQCHQLYPTVKGTRGMYEREGGKWKTEAPSSKEVKIELLKIEQLAIWFLLHFRGSLG